MRVFGAKHFASLTNVCKQGSQCELHIQRFVLGGSRASVKLKHSNLNVLQSEMMWIQMTRHWKDDCVVRIFDSFGDSTGVLISGKSVQTKSGHSTSHARLPPPRLGRERKTKVTGHDCNRWRGSHLNTTRLPTTMEQRSSIWPPTWKIQ